MCVFAPRAGFRGECAGVFGLPNVVCVGGSWLTPADALARGDWAQITALAQQACQLKRA
jgi:2-dehydro-3-deoxyphosphogluconate aldolase/(4S)-4-hydroxy-2-oxoglutarate aldolase